MDNGARLQRSPGRRPGKRNVGPVCKWSRTRVVLRFLRVVLAWYIFATLGAKLVLNLGVGKPPSIGLRPKDMPAGQRLRLKSRRRSEGGLCKGYSAVEDPYFVPYGGNYCGTMTYEAKPTGAPAGAEAEQLQKIELTYKAFETDEHAKEYFWRFWGIHSHSILPSSVYVDVSQKLPSVGDEHRALYYNPGLMMHSPGDNTFQAAHMLYFNRVGRTVMVLSISGFPKIQTTMINPELAQALATAVEQRIVYPWKSAAEARDVAKSVLRLGCRLEARVNRIFNLGEKLADQVDAGIKDLSKHVAQEASRIEEASRRSAEAFMRIDVRAPGPSVVQRVPDAAAAAAAAAANTEVAAEVTDEVAAAGATLERARASREAAVAEAEAAVVTARAGLANTEAEVAAFRARVATGRDIDAVVVREADEHLAPVAAAPAVPADDMRANKSSGAYWSPKEANSENQEGGGGTEFGLWVAREEEEEEEEVATTMLASRCNDSEDFGVVQQPVQPSHLLVAQALRPVRPVLPVRVVLETGDEKAPYRQPLYFGHDRDPSDELDYQGVETADSHEVGETGAECSEVLRALQVLQLTAAPDAECHLPPIADLGVSATVIMLVFLLIGAGEIIDPPDYDRHAPSTTLEAAPRLLPSK